MPCFHLSRQVALGLSERFPDVVLIKEQLSVLVFEHAHLPAVQALPRALPFLVTPETVAQSLPQASAPPAGPLSS